MIFSEGQAVDEKSIKFAIDAIEAHLQSHPDSADTVEGIHQWWIRWPDFPEAMSVTSAALEWLEQTGVVQRSQTGNREIWRRPRAAQSDLTD